MWDEWPVEGGLVGDSDDEGERWHEMQEALHKKRKRKSVKPKSPTTRPKTKTAPQTSKFFPSSCNCHVKQKELFDECVEAAKFALNQLGPGQTERAYEDVICNYLYDHRRPVRRQAQYFNVVDGHTIPIGVVDVEVDHSIILELKVNHAAIKHEHKVQLQRYLRSMNEKKTSDECFIGAIFLFANDGSLQMCQSH